MRKSKKKKLAQNRMLFTIIIVLLIVGAFFGMVYFEKFTGFLGYMLNATAGTITSMVIVHQTNPSYYAGLYGNAYYDINDLDDTSREYTIVPGNMTEATDLNFNCMGGTGFDIYASTYDYTTVNNDDWLLSIQGATIDDLNAFMNFDYDYRPTLFEAPNNTFTSNITINFGGRNLTGVGLYTKQANGTSVFGMVALVDRYPGPTNGTIIFGIDTETFAPGFDSRYRNVQFMLAIPRNNASVTYYIFPDPISDQLGSCRAVEQAVLDGYVTHVATGARLENVSVRITSRGEAKQDYTNASGYYQLLPYVGEAFLQAEKDGFLDYAAVLNITTYMQYNFSMIPDLSAHLGNTSLYGYVYDNLTGLPLENVIVSGGGGATVTNASGYYYLILVAGEVNITAIKEGYQTHFGYLNLTAYDTYEYNINISPADYGDAFVNGSVYGIVTDNFTGMPMAGVVVAIGSQMNVTGEDGIFNITIAKGNYTLSASKEKYVNYITNVTVFGANATYINISMHYYQSLIQRNGTLIGTVIDKNTSAPIEGAMVNIGDQNVSTNLTGGYSIDVPPGTYVVTVTKYHYEVNWSIVTINQNETTEYNVSLDYFVAEKLKNGTVTGMVRDVWVDVALPNVSIQIGDQTTYTNSSGEYSIDIAAGIYVIAATKEHYETHIGNVTVNEEAITNYNISLDWFVAEKERNGTIIGRVIDSYNGSMLEGVAVQIGDQTEYTNSSGEYSIDIPAGSYVIAATKEHYKPHVGNAAISIGIVSGYNISLDYFVEDKQRNGSVAGFVVDDFDNSSIENATVWIVDQTQLTNASGEYNITLPAGTYVIVATKDNYVTYVGQVQINISQTTYRNISMSYTQGSGVIGRNGTITGYIYDGTNGTPISNVNIFSGYVSGLSDVNGNYSIQIPAGNYTLVYAKNPYRPYITSIVVEQNKETRYDVLLSMEEAGQYANFERITRNITEYVTERFNFSLSNLTINVTTNENITNAILDKYEYITYPPSSVPPDFQPIGNFYEILSNWQTDKNENLTYYVPYDSSLFPSGINDSQITLFYFDSISDEWVELNTSLDEDNHLVYSTDRFFVYTIGVKRPVINGTVIDADDGERLSNVTVYFNGVIDYTDENGSYTLHVRNRTDYLIAIKDGYFNYINLTTLQNGEILERTIELEKYSLPGAGPGLGPGVGPGLGPGAGPGAGPGTGVPTEEQANPDALEIYTSLDSIKKKVRKDSFVEESMTIYNFKQTSSELFFNVSGNVAPHIDLNMNHAIIEPNSSAKLVVRLLGNGEPGFYTGRLKISGAMDAIIPIELTITNEGKIPLKSLILKIDTLQKSAYRGEEFRYKVDMINLLTGTNFDVRLNFTLSSINGSYVLPLGEQTAQVQTFTSILRKAKIPPEIQLGDYMLSVDAEYLEYKSSANTLFVVSDPFYKYNLFGVFPVWLLSTFIGLFSTAFFVFIIIKKQKEKNKRFHAKIDYKALPKEGERTLFVGFIAETKHKFYLDMDNLTVHTIVAGSTGGGKSISAQDIVEEALLKGVAVAVFDPTAQWSGMLRKLADKKFLGFYADFGMNPKKDARAFPGNIKAVKDHREQVDIFKYLKPGEIQVFTTNTLDPRNYDTFVANMIRQIFHSKLDEFRGLKYMVVFDEIHRILPKFGGSGEGFTQIERGCREFRKWGIGIMLISQVLSDFVGEIKANINTLVQMKTRDEGDLNRIKMQYGEEFIQSLVKSPVGSGMIQNSAYNYGQPFYVTFRPIMHSVVRLKDEELEEYNRWNDVVEQIEYEFDQLEKEKQDVFDLRLELKLAKDKIKSGNFNMVKIYLDGLTPRITKVWDKIGKQPQKLQIKLISEDDLKAELAAAKKAKEEAKAAEAAASGAAVVKKEEEEDLKISPEELKEKMKGITKLFKDMEEALANKDYFSISDRIIEVQSVSLPKKEKGEVNAKIEDMKKKVEAAKSGAANAAAAPAAAAATGAAEVESK